MMLSIEVKGIKKDIVAEVQKCRKVDLLGLWIAIMAASCGLLRLDLVALQEEKLGEQPPMKRGSIQTFSNQMARISLSNHPTRPQPLAVGGNGCSKGRNSLVYN
ncbi:hypothetical protein LWI28_003014 [Acer negundo]|uniref:Uncharacterized protein n=1 Tax=Acer negundo TaxID=4023 RepID=A0AAD5I5A6_ACENE|nr:hypothetical protein LWI28_003014 [Acer negundo]